ncbi:AsmA family protein [Methylomagnum ishizawai]|uniref:AsmA family protein n=1 Tax=Methylomagnum ishizawai TaxID=1760988 RepID=UPI001C32B212|nr:AsmA family protein [Methylomagnum ishizawai]BBL77389.1 membrane protein [Methylomagnum ishizawai]
MNSALGYPSSAPRRAGRTVSGQILKWTGIALGVSILALVLFVLFFDLNRLRGPIGSLVSAKLGREFAIRGPLTVAWSWTPRLGVADIVLADAPWGRHSEMFSLDRAEVSLRIPDLFKGHLVLPDIRIVKPRLYLEKDAQGRANWEFKPPPAQSEPMNPRWFPKIDRLVIEEGRVRFDDAANDTALDLDISTAAGTADEQSLKLKGQGSLKNERFTLDARGGSILTLWDRDKPFPVEIEAAYGASGAKVAGGFQEPLRLGGPDLKFEAHGPDLSVFRPFTELWIPRTPPYRFSGTVDRDGERWRIKDFQGKLGGSDLAGGLMFTLREGRPLLDGDLVSKRLDFRDLAGFVGADPRPDAPSRPRFFPDESYDVKGLRVADADIRFRSANIVTPMMPVDQVSAHVRLDHGVLTLDPANASIGLGKIASSIMLDARGYRIKTRLRSRIEQVPFQRLLAKTRFAPESSGTFFGRVAVDTVGNSVAEMAANADGGITVLMESGRISELIMELIGLDIAETLQILATRRDRAMPVRCLVNDFMLSDGVMQTQLFLLDTTDTQVRGEGRVDLRDETLHLRFLAHPKDVSVFSARTPVVVDGTLKRPSGHPEVLPLAARAAASVALGAVLTPAAAILPWVELGLGQDSPCRSLLTAAEKAEPPARPKAGKGKRP